MYLKIVFNQHPTILIHDHKIQTLDCGAFLKKSEMQLSTEFQPSTTAFIASATPAN